jgi:hypothetical protein
LKVLAKVKTTPLDLLSLAFKTLAMENLIEDPAVAYPPRYLVEIYSRTHEQALFSYQWFDEIDQVIPFPDLGFEMQMKEV